jgi:hypothetical protein
MASRYNEGKAIDAVLRLIETRDRVVRKNDGFSPDDLNDPDPLRRVDYVCTVGKKLYAFEHTGIEPFADQIKLEVQNRTLFAPIERQFSNRRDRELWELHVPVEASANLIGAEVKLVQDALIAWIKVNASRLPVTLQYSKPATPHLGQTAPGIPFPFSLHRGSLDSPYFPAGHPFCGKLIVKYYVRADVEQARMTRLHKACKDKFSKLAVWKRDGAETVLVLEESDMFLTNEGLVADAFLRAEKDFSDQPDEIFLVSTYVDNAWWVTCLRRGETTYYDDDDERPREIDPAVLVGLTKR